MEIYTINDWTSGTYVLSLPSSVKLIEIYDANGTLLSDSYNVKLTNYGQLQLDYENYAGSVWPLKVVTFDVSSAVGSSALFDQQFSAPANQMRFGIGKRHETAKNVNFKELCKYVNDDGGVAITKDFTGFDTALGRDNLSVYSTEEVNSMMINLATFEERYSYPYYGTKLVAAAPFINGSDNTATANARFKTTVKGDEVRVNVKVKFNGLTLGRRDPVCVGSVFDIMYTNAYKPSNTVIAYAKYKNEQGWPIVARRYSRASGTYDDLTIDNLLYLPPLVLTAGATSLGGKNLEPDCFYFVPTWEKAQRSFWWQRLINGAITIEYDLVFYTQQ